MYRLNQRNVRPVPASKAYDEIDPICKPISGNSSKLPPAEAPPVPVAPNTHLDSYLRPQIMACRAPFVKNVCGISEIEWNSYLEWVRYFTK